MRIEYGKLKIKILDEEREEGRMNKSKGELESENVGRRWKEGDDSRRSEDEERKNRSWRRIKEEEA